MGDVVVDKLIYVVEVTTAKAKKGLAKFAGWVSKPFRKIIEGAFFRIGQKITDGLIRLPENLVKAFGRAIDETAKFETALAEVSTLGQFNMGQLKRGIEDVAIAIGEDLADATRAVYQAISAGVDEASALPFTKTAAKAAVGGLASLETSVDALSSVMNAYRKTTEDVEHISDLFFTTIKLGKTRFSELASSIGRVGPIAFATGISMEEMFGSIAALTKVGLKTEEAMTGLRSALSQLLTPSEKAQKVLEGVFGAGVDISEVLSQKGLLGIIDEIGRAEERFGERSGNIIKQVFEDVRGLNAVLALRGQNSTIDAMENVQGATETAFAKMADTWERAKGRLAAVFSVMKTNLFDPIVKVAADMGNAVADFFSGKDWHPSEENMAAFMRETDALVLRLQRDELSWDEYEKQWNLLHSKYMESPGQQVITSLRNWSTELSEVFTREFGAAMKGKKTWTEAIKTSLAEVGIHFSEIKAAAIKVIDGVMPKIIEIGEAIGEGILRGITNAILRAPTNVANALARRLAAGGASVNLPPGFAQQGVDTRAGDDMVLGPIESARGSVNITINGTGQSAVEVAQEVVRIVERNQLGGESRFMMVP